MAKPADGKPASAERGALTTFLVAKGFTGQALAAIVKANRTRRQIADDLTGLFRGLKK